MISKFINDGLVAFYDSFDTWEEAVRASCNTLRNQGYINEQYENAIVDNIHEHGPYIVILPGIAMPHSTQGGEGVFKTGIAFMKVEKPVLFDDNGEIKDAQLFFTLAAEDADQHLQNITDLMELLMNEDVVEALKKTKSLEDLKTIANTYNL